MMTDGKARIDHWLKDLDWYDTILIHQDEVKDHVAELILKDRGTEFLRNVKFVTVRSPNDLLQFRGMKFGLVAWPGSLDEFAPFVLAEFCALKEKIDGRKARKG